MIYTTLSLKNPLSSLKIQLVSKPPRSHLASVYI